MDKGVCHTYRAAAFPRYRYFQCKQDRLLPRWQRILGAGRFPDCISQGTDSLKEMISSAKQIKEEVHVMLFGDAAFLNTDKLDFAVQTNMEIVGDIPTREVTWTSFLQEKTLVESAVIVISIQSLEEKVVKNLEAKLSLVPKTKHHNIIVFIEDSKVCFQYQVLAKAGFILADVRSQSEPDLSMSLKKQIQYLLEKKVISVLEDIVAYNDHFIPKKQHNVSDLPIDAVKDKLERTLSNPYVVKDLSPYGKEESGVEEDPLTQSSKSMVDKIFHENLSNFFAKTTRLVMCEKLSLKWGISPSLINAFLNELGFEKKVEEMMVAMSLPSWPSDRQQNLVSICKPLVQKCVDLTNIIQETVRYVTTKHDLMRTLKKLQFELYGLLQQTDVVMDTTIPAIPKLPEELQQALLQIPEVYGCGTIWGMLELHLTAVLSTESEVKVKNVLRKYKYKYGHTTSLVEKPKWQVYTIEQGKGLLARKLVPDDGEYKCGTIGCFVNVKRRRADGVLDEVRLHCLTCAHCVSDCDTQVLIQNRLGLVNLGTKLYEIYRGEALDVASIEIDPRINRNCEKTLKDSADFPFGHRWSFYQGQPVRMSVFKYGCVTDLTLGVCVSMDYKTKQMLEDSNRRNGTNFCPDYNILIAPPPNVPQGAHIEGTEGAADQPVQAETNTMGPFSMEGDSGSVVCDDNIDTGEVTVISLLCGDIKEKIDENQTRFLYSYTTHIQKVVSALTNTYGCEIEPAC